ncbi:MAG: hypothetical protein JOZ07_06420 [Solirubrobacterales bacterium]|nr:hypothetical protein [Solirubrobacterales bacterium]
MTNTPTTFDNYMRYVELCEWLADQDVPAHEPSPTGQALADRLNRGAPLDDSPGIPVASLDAYRTARRAV